MKKKLLNHFLLLLVLALLSPVLLANDGEKEIFLEEGFETEIFPPEGWTMLDQDGDSYNWAHGRILSDPSVEVHSGIWAAASFSFRNPNTGEETGSLLIPDNWLISPQITIPDKECHLCFWIGAQNQILYNEKYDVLISTTDTNISSFTSIHSETLREATGKYYEVILPLDAYKGQNIYIAFRHWNSSDNYAILLDDVTVCAVSEDPEFNGSSTLDFGYTFLTEKTYQKNYTITNTGKSDLSLSLGNVAQNIVVTGLSGTLAYMESKVITVEFTPTKVGDYKGSFVITTNDPKKTAITINVTSSVTTEKTSSYMTEDFEGLPYNAIPVGWNGSLRVFTYGGVDNSNKFSVSLSNLIRTAQMVSNFVAMGNAPKLNFQYCFSTWGNAAPPESFMALIYVSEDAGQTWDLVHVLDRRSHIASSDYQLLQLDLSAYAGKTCNFMIQVDRIYNNVTFDLDNILFGTEPDNDLAAYDIIEVNPFIIAGEEASFIVSVENIGRNTQTAYNVQLLKEDGSVLASVPGLSIKQGESLNYELKWIPEQEDIISVYGCVVLAGDEAEMNNKTKESVTAHVLPAAIVKRSIGDGQELVNMPFSFMSSYSLTQTLYFPYEVMSNGGKIYGVLYNSKFDESINNIPIQLWIGETDEETLSNEWIDSTSLTMVFNGTINFTEDDGTDVMISFSEPYTYSGGNLVVLAYKSDNTMRFGKQFYGGYIENSARSRVKTGTSNNPPIPSAGTLLDTYPNITFLLNPENMGALTGTVSDLSGPLEGVKVQVAGYNLYTFTDENGQYTLPYLMPGGCELEISLYGYYNSTISDIKIVTATTTKEDITLQVIPQSYAMSGTVTESHTGNPLEGVIISLSGYADYSVATDENGVYNFAGIYGSNGFMYEVEGYLKDYVIFSSEVEINQNISVYNIELSEIAIPVGNIIATESNDGNAAIISWSQPTLVDFRYDSGLNAGQRGFQISMPYIDRNYSVMGSVFRTKAQVDEVSWYLKDEGGPHNQINVFIFDLDENGNPTSNILYHAVVPNTDMTWNTHVLHRPVSTPNGFMVAVSYLGFVALGTDVPSEEYPFVPQTQYYANDYTTGAFGSMDSSMQESFMLRAKGIDLGFSKESSCDIMTTPALSDDEQGVESIIFIENAPYMTDTPIYSLEENYRGLQNYTIYRLKEGEPQTEWIKIADDCTETIFTDNGWAMLDYGFYQYAVVAQYDNVTSVAKGSNIIPKDMMVEYTVNITDTERKPIIGAIVKLTPQTADLSKFYIATSENASVTFPSVWRGKYDLTITLDGYKVYSAVDIDINNTGQSHNAQLEEIIIRPYGLEVVQIDKDVSFSWNNGTDAFFDDMESHENFIYEGINSYTLIDNDGLPTYGFGSGYSFDNEGYIGSYIVFNPSQMMPSWNHDMVDMRPHSGDKFLACFSTVKDANDDWLILPKIKVIEGMKFTFWAKTFLKNINFEWLRIGVSTTGTMPADFSFIQTEDYIEVPQEWTEYSFDLSPYVGKNIHLSINCISEDVFFLMLDDISVSNPNAKPTRATASYTIYLDENEVASGLQETEYIFKDVTQGIHTAGVKTIYSSGESEITNIDFVMNLTAITSIDISSLKVYPNPFTDEIFINDIKNIKRIKISSVTGQMIKDFVPTNTNISLSEIPNGVYFISLEDENDNRIVHKVIKQ